MPKSFLIKIIKFFKNIYGHKCFLSTSVLRPSPSKTTFFKKNVAISKGPFGFWTFLKCPFLKKVGQT